MSTALEISETAILSRALAAGSVELSSDAARSILAIELSPEDQAELQRLLDLSQAGSLTPEEESHLENYLHTGRVLELLKSKARISLKRSKNAPHEPRA